LVFITIQFVDGERETVSLNIIWAIFRLLRHKRAIYPKIIRRISIEVELTIPPFPHTEIWKLIVIAE